MQIGFLSHAVAYGAVCFFLLFVAGFKTALVVKRLPKTRSGKILRGTIKRIADSQAYTAPATIDDPLILEEITDALKTAGYAKGTS